MKPTEMLIKMQIRLEFWYYSTYKSLSWPMCISKLCLTIFSINKNTFPQFIPFMRATVAKWETPIDYIIWYVPVHLRVCAWMKRAFLGRCRKLIQYWHLFTLIFKHSRWFKMYSEIVVCLFIFDTFVLNKHYEIQWTLVDRCQFLFLKCLIL